MASPDPVEGQPTRHRLEVRFAVPDLWISDALLGRRFSNHWADKDCGVEICFPAHSSDFIPFDESETVRVPALRLVTEQRILAQGVQIMLVNVRALGRGSAEQKCALKDDPEAFQEMIGESWSNVMEVAEEGIRHFLAWFRVLTKQPWLGLAEEPPPQYGRAHLFDEDASKRLISYGPLKVGTIYLEDRSLSEEAAEVLESNLVKQKPVPVAEALLADAEFLHEQTETVDAHRAVLAAAMACEIKLKHVIRAASTPESKLMVDLIVGRQSDIGILGSKVFKAVIGRSLEDDNADLLRSLRTLAQKRNEVVHEGTTIQPLEALPLVTAARRLFDWLGQLYPERVGEGS